MKLLLESLGYETRVVPGVFRRTGIPNSHLALLVNIPYRRASDPFAVPQEERGDVYLVDVGCGVPIHEPVLIRPSVPYKSRAGGLDFYYETLPNGDFHRVNQSGDALIGPVSC
jgi:arylamine N-acetyltransferase